MKVKIITLGCKVNAYESELIKERFESNGDTITDENNADVVVINTCTVTNNADVKSRKEIRGARRENPNACIVVCGCAAEHHKEDLIDLDMDILIGNKDKSKIVNLVRDFKNNNEKVVKFYDLRNESFEDMEIKNFHDKNRGFVKIQDGCDNFCAYCIIPFMRGNIRSKDIETAVSEINCLADQGFHEIVLTGIHTGSYGRNEDFDIVDLIQRVSKNENLQRIRISSIEITELNDKFMEEYKTNKKICSHMHVPVQCPNDTILQAMRRKYTMDEYFKKLNELRTIRPDINITTDLIVGFPGETNEIFANMIENTKKCGFSKIHVFPYSERTGTLASTLPNKVDGKIKRKRTHEMLELSDELEHNYYETYKGKTVNVLVEDDNTGFTSNYIKVHLDKECSPNTFVDCKITEVDGIIVKGTVI